MALMLRLSFEAADRYRSQLLRGAYGVSIDAQANSPCGEQGACIP
jgi:hypothetical protein